MNDLVLDASAGLHVVLRRSGFESLLEVLESASRVVAPRLYLSEAANALWKYVNGGYLEEKEALARLDEMRALVVHPIEDGRIVKEALTTAVRYEHPVYDAMYAVLARRLSSPLMTRDRRLKALLKRLRVDCV